MNRDAASRCRQRIRDCLDGLGRLAAATQGRGPMIRGSFYAYRRRCGKSGCRCSRGKLHVGQALSVSEAGRSRVVPMAGMDDDVIALGVRAWREHRRTRAEMTQVFGLMLEAIDRLADLRVMSGPQACRPAGGGR